MKKLLFSLVCLLIFSPIGEMASAEHLEELKLTSEAAVLMDSQSGTLLFGKNEEKRMYPASLTKIATAIYAIETGVIDDVVTISKRAVMADGTRVYLNEGEKVPLGKLIEGMLVNSGNDAAIAIAEHLDGSVEQFSANINNYLSETVGTKGTHFTNPNGLFDEHHYTTAADLGLITNHAMKDPLFREIFGKKTLKWKGESWETVLHSHHRLLKGEIPFEGVTGGKTGFVNEAKQTLATTADNGGIKLTAIVLKADFKRDIYQDTMNLIDFGFAHFKTGLLYESSLFNETETSFTLLEDTFITEPVTGSVKSVSEDGWLTVENDNGEVIQTVKLEPSEVEKKVKKENTQKTVEKSSILDINPVLGLAFIAACIFLVLAVRRPRRKRR
ncbi:D-alanyl-D-alanine carboxypeptidase family protein [Mesobacillus harenae]|uniref:D-alanyl-D-alanine carboxypeptidase family protein n=1 Tax=Mesobacillus harenae TaxID=2213203 RepID=UPI00158102B8|nr:D-alanyl-D-alanine carboxypeptidase family protein [Mesobacillus harenae]